MFNRSYVNSHVNHLHYLNDKRIASLKKGAERVKKDDLKILKNLTDATKFKIYTTLAKVDEICVSDLSLISNVSQSAISHALSDLEYLGLVEIKKCGKLNCYSLKKTQRLKNIFNNLIIRR